MPGKYGALEQNQIIDKARKRRMTVLVFLKNGIHLKGKITRFDVFTILFKTEKGYLLIYKHAISTIIPIKKNKKTKNISTKKSIKITKKKSKKDIH